MFLTAAKIFTWNKTYTPITITNENGKGKPFFSYFKFFLRLRGYSAMFFFNTNFHELIKNLRPASIGNDVHDM